MKFALVHDLESFLAAEFEAEAVSIVPDLCPVDFDGDITVNCFQLARQLRRSPMQIAQRAAEFLSGHEDVAAVEAVKAFVNVSLCSEALFRDTVADPDALLEAVPLHEPQRRRFVIEFSAPNTNKPQHLGHVRNNSLGAATTAILRRVGHSVVPVNLVNDRGIHICKSMLAYQRWGDGQTPESTGKKGDHWVGEFYVRFDRELRQQLAALRQTVPQKTERSDEELFLETEIGRAAQDMLVRWENGDRDVRALWQTMNGWVIAGFEETYRRMGIAFDHTYLESKTYTLGKSIIEDGLDKGVFTRRADGAVAIDLAEAKLGEKVVLRSDGTSVYVTQDIGTTLLKQQDFEPNSQIWIVGDEQIYHFNVLFAILRALGYPWAENLHHMAYGMVNLPEGKMKSREGTVVDADDLFDEMEQLARDATLDRTEGVAPEDLNQRAGVIAMAAIKFMLLKVNPRTTITFDPAAAIKFEGDTGPYVLYALARINSMFRKAGQEALAGTVDWSLPGSPEERDLALRCAGYGDALRKAAETLDPSQVAAYLLELAKAFSRFWRSCPVLSAPTPQLRRVRLELSRRVHLILADGLRTLTLDTLEQM